MFPELLGALSEGQRPLAHLVVLLGIVAGLAVVGLVHLRRRRSRRLDERGPREGG